MVGVFAHQAENDLIFRREYKEIEGLDIEENLNVAGAAGDFANFDQQATNNLDAVRASVKSKTETSADHDEKYSLANLNALSEQEFEQRKSSWKGQHITRGICYGFNHICD